MCCWHSLWLHRVSSKAVYHSLVTQGQLLIPQERDVLSSALGSLEDKQCAAPVDSVIMAKKAKRCIWGCTKFTTDASTSHISFAPPPCASPRPHKPACVHGSCLCTTPTCEPGDFSAHSDPSGENGHVMEEYLLGNRMF